MRKIEFKQVCLEWHLLINDKLVYIEDNDCFYEAVNSINGQILMSDLEGYVSELVDYIRYRFTDEDIRVQEYENFDKFSAVSILKALTDEEWEEIEKTIRVAYANYYDIKDRRFTYKGLTFEAVGNILGGFVNKSNHTIYEKNPTIQRYDVKDFYKVAKSHHASCDVYRIGYSEDYYMLCGSGNVGTFRKVDLKDYSDFKTCDAYSTWYK